MQYCDFAGFEGFLVSPPVRVIVLSRNKQGFVPALVSLARTTPRGILLRVEYEDVGKWVSLEQLQVWNKTGIEVKMPEDLSAQTELAEPEARSAEASGKQVRVNVDRGRRYVIITIGAVLAAAATAVGGWLLLGKKINQPAPVGKEPEPSGKSR